MAFQTIGDINLAIADREAGAVERGAKDLTTLGSNIQGGMNNALESASVLQKQAIDEQRQKDADAILKTGVEGIGRYGEELNSQGANLDVQMYKNMASTTKDPKELKNYYALMKKKAEKDVLDKRRLESMSGINAGVVGLKEKIDAGTVTEKDFDSVLLGIEGVSTSGTTDNDVLKAANTTSDNVRALKDDHVKSKGGAKPKEAVESILDMRNQFIKETKDGAKMLHDANVLRSAFLEGKYVNEKGITNAVASDQALIMSFNRILDPTSVVRESEYGRTGQSQGMVDNIKGWFAKLIEGGSGLTEDGRKAVFKMSELIVKGAMMRRFEKMKEFEDLNKIAGVSPEQASLSIPGFESLRGDYETWREDPAEYERLVTEELNKNLSKAEQGTIETNRKKKKKSKENTVEDISFDVAPGGSSSSTPPVSQASASKKPMTLDEKRSRLAELKARQGGK
jgi:hypothetical protein